MNKGDSTDESTPVTVTKARKVSELVDEALATAAHAIEATAQHLSEAQQLQQHMQSAEMTEAHEPVLDALSATREFGCCDVNSISCTLDIVTDRTPLGVPGLLNRFEQPGAKMLSCEMSHPAIFTGNDLVDMTPGELSAVACDGPKPLPAKIHLSSGFEGLGELQFTAANGKWFTVQEFLDVVGKLETAVRGETEWFGGIDAHHVYFEGLMGANGRYSVEWGS